MSDVKEPLAEIGVTTLKGLYGPVAKNLEKIDSLMEGHYMGQYRLSNPDVMILMELNVSCRALMSTLSDLIEQAKEAYVESVFLPGAEVKVIATIAHSLMTSFELGIGNIRFLEN